MKICEYGCGELAIYQFKSGKVCCSKNHKSCPGMKHKGLPDPKTNPANVKQKCEYCNNLIARSGLNRHKDKCYLNPKNLTLCPQCNTPVKKENKFCSKRCAALTNSPGRKHTLETKKKISASLGGKSCISNHNMKCTKCGIILKTSRLYCDICLSIVKSENNIRNKTHEKLSLSFTHYEKALCDILIQFYGNLKKEKINGSYFDFCNEKYIIDFTFDSTKGTSELIERFSNVKDKREKIAFIPDKNVGQFRRLKLQKSDVKILSSNPYKFLM